MRTILIRVIFQDAVCPCLDFRFTTNKVKPQGCPHSRTSPPIVHDSFGILQFLQITMFTSLSEISHSFRSSSLFHSDLHFIMSINQMKNPQNNYESTDQPTFSFNDFLSESNSVSESNSLLTSLTQIKIGRRNMTNRWAISKLNYWYWDRESDADQENFVDVCVLFTMVGTLGACIVHMRWLHNITQEVCDNSTHTKTG